MWWDLCLFLYSCSCPGLHQGYVRELCTMRLQFIIFVNCNLLKYLRLWCSFLFVILVLCGEKSFEASGCHVICDSSGQKHTAELRAVLWGLGLDTGEEPQVEWAGDLDSFQGEGRRAEREGDRIYHLCVHQQLRTLTTVSQASLKEIKKTELDHNNYSVSLSPISRSWGLLRSTPNTKIEK